LDIDTLKKINDTFGHVAGDETIVTVSKCIKNAFGDVAECFRMGGDEFLVAMTADEDIVEERIEQFEKIVSQWHGRYVENLDVSYGIAAAKEHPGLNFEELLKTADYMMYQSKKHQTECNV
jgi:diguanylate cyclase (GGDEF)-like protein